MIRVVGNPRELEDILARVETFKLVSEVSEAVAENARSRAPTDPLGRTAREGILTEVVLTPDGWEGRVGHAKGAYGFWLARREFGTRYQAPRPHLRPAARMPVRI